MKQGTRHFGTRVLLWLALAALTGLLAKCVAAHFSLPLAYVWYGYGFACGYLTRGLLVRR